MQHDDLAEGRKARSTDDLDAIEQELEAGDTAKPAPAAPEKPFGFVAVCAGEGLAGVFRDLGADGIIEVGQTMNPCLLYTSGSGDRSGRQLRAAAS